MSVSSEQKQEIIEYTYKSSCCRRAILNGVLFAKGQADGKRITITLERREYADFVSRLAGEFYGKEVDIHRSPKGGRSIYVSFDSPSAAKYLQEIEELETAEIADLVILKCRSCLSSFLRGVFLASGRLSDPQVQYALDFTLGDRTRLFAGILEVLDMTPRISNKKSGAVLYFRRGEDIENFYGHAGLNRVVFDVIERKITTLARRETQRYLNCVTKNYDRMTVASERQLNIIRRLEAHNLLSSLPEELEHTARARLEYPDLPLSLLVTKLPESITKSGLSHRLRRIEELGRELLGLDEE